MEFTAEYANRMDQADALATIRDEFFLPVDSIYFDGNSLGLLSKNAQAVLHATLEQWKNLGINGWLEADPPWFDIVEQLSTQLGHLLGAGSTEMTVGNSTTVNLHQLLATFYEPHARAKRILVDTLLFRPIDMP